MAMASSDLDLDSIYTFALQLGKDAGRLLLEAAQRRMSGADQLVEEEKLNSVDIVTKTDEGELYCFGLYIGKFLLGSRLLIFCWFVASLEVEAFIRKAIFEKYPEHKYV